jgi:hypothetical protein
MLSADGIHTFVDVVIANPTQIDLVLCCIISWGHSLSIGKIDTQ